MTSEGLHPVIRVGDPKLERFAFGRDEGSMRDVVRACDRWLEKRGLRYDNPDAERMANTIRNAQAARAKRMRAAR